jgi:hypothetical protein
MENSPQHLEEAALDLYEACKDFIKKVEACQARSAKSYAQMKAAIAKAEGRFNPGGPLDESALTLASASHRPDGRFVDSR